MEKKERWGWEPLAGFWWKSSLPRMVLQVHLFKAVCIHVRVDLRGGDVGMAQKLLHDAQIGAAGEQMGGEGMPKRVRVNVANPRPPGHAADKLPEHDPRHRPAGARDEHVVGMGL